MSPQQRRFVSEYVVDFNATQAAIRANYSVKTAYSQGQRLLKSVEIAAAIDAEMTLIMERARIKADRVVRELARVAFANMDSFAQWSNGGVKLKDSDDLSFDEKAAVAEISETVTANGGTVKFKLHPKLPALEQLAKYLGLNQDDSAERAQPIQFIIQAQKIDDDSNDKPDDAAD